MIIDDPTSAEIARIKQELKDKGYSRLVSGSGVHYDSNTVIAQLKKISKYSVILKGPGNWNIEVNHNYKPWYKIDYMTALVAAILTLTVGICLQKLDNRSTNRELEKINAKVDILRARADSTRNRLSDHLKDSTSFCK